MSTLNPALREVPVKRHGAGGLLRQRGLRRPPATQNHVPRERLLWQGPGKGARGRGRSAEPALCPCPRRAQGSTHMGLLLGLESRFRDTVGFASGITSLAQVSLQTDSAPLRSALMSGPRVGACGTQPSLFCPQGPFINVHTNLSQHLPGGCSREAERSRGNAGGRRSDCSSARQDSLAVLLLSGSR